MAVPLHFHIGMRSVLVDYVHDRVNQKLAFAALAAATVVTAAGLAVFTYADVGVVEGLRQLFIEQPVPAEELKKH